MLLSPLLGGSLLRCPCIYKEYFYWMGFDRENKRDFLTAFSDKPGFFVESCICDGLRRAVIQSHINRRRQIDVKWSRVRMTWGWPVWRNHVFATVA